MSLEVPFVDLAGEHAPLLPELQAASERVYRHGRFVGGPEVEQLELALADYVGVRHCIAAASGTTALLLALMALQLAPGDEVIVPAFTFAAPVEAVLLLGGVPVLVDIETDGVAVCVDAVAAAITPRTRAIIAVSLYGQPADYVALEALARQHGLSLIEDGAQSFGSSLHGRRSGAFGDLGCTSFYPTKPLGGCGDGGAVFTQQDALARRLRELRDHGQVGKYRHQHVGMNGRLDTLSCAALLVKFARFPAALQRRQHLAQRYDVALASLLPPDALPPHRVGASGAQALYCVQLDERDRVQRQLAGQGIASAVHYPESLHRQPAFAARCRWGDLPRADRLAARGLCLPLYPTLSDSQQDRVIAALAAAVRT